MQTLKMEKNMFHKLLFFVKKNHKCESNKMRNKKLEIKRREMKGCEIKECEDAAMGIQFTEERGKPQITNAIEFCSCLNDVIKHQRWSGLEHASRKVLPQ